MRVEKIYLTNLEEIESLDQSNQQLAREILKLPMYKRKRDNDFDSGRIEDLSNILNTASTDLTKNHLLNEFLSHGYGTQVLQAWSFYSQSSDHSKLANSTSILASLIVACNDFSDGISQGSRICREIIDSHLKVVYRCLFLLRPGVSVPAMKLITNIARFNGGSLINDLYSGFDFGLKVIPKLLSTEGLRFNFIEFLFSLLTIGSSIIKKDIISHKKIISSWIKGLNMDSEVLLLEMIDIFRNKICMDKSFLKSSKLSFFNDWVLGNLLKLFHRKDLVPQALYDFLLLLSTDSMNGIKFLESGWYPAKLNEENQSEPLKVNERTEKLLQPIYNKSLLSFLHILKPWEDILQQKLVLSILLFSPELVSPYVCFLDEHLSFDPKLTSFWVSYSTLMSKIVSLPIPTRMPTSIVTPPDFRIVIDSVLPANISKSSLSKCLKDNLLVRYLSTEIIICGLKKYCQIKIYYEKQKWDEVPLRDEFLKRLPDIQTLTSSLQNVKKSSEFLRATMYMAITLYSKTFPDILSGQPISKSLEITKWENISGINLLNLHNALELETISGSSGKWWNKNTSTNMSLFTTVLRLASLNVSLKIQIARLLHKLLTPTLAFQDKTLTSPIEILLNSLYQNLPTNEVEQIKLWTLFDESISRVMRSPYKYIDCYSNICGNGSFQARSSPFIIALLEQWEYVDKTTSYKNLENWVSSYVRDSCICGENWQVANELANKLESYKPFKGEEIPLEGWFDCKKSSLFGKLFCQARDLKTVEIKSLSELEAAKFRIMHSKDNKTRALLFDISSPWINNMLDCKYFMSLAENILIFDEYIDCIQNHLQTNNDITSLKNFLKSRTDLTIRKGSLLLLDSSDIISLIISQSNNASFVATALDVLNSKNHTLDIDQYILLAKPEASYDENLSKNIQICEVFSEELADIFFKNRLRSSFVSIVEKASYIKPEWKEIVTELEGHTLMRFASVVLKLKFFSDQTNLVTRAISYALDNLNDGKSLEFLGESIGILERPDINKITKFIESANYPMANSSYLVNLTGIILVTTKVDSSDIKKYTQRRILWLTKYFSERMTITDKEKGFLLDFGKQIKEGNLRVWEWVPKNYVNDLITSILNKKWISEPEIVDFANILVFNAPKIKIDYTKHFQILINIDELIVNQNICLLIYRLYCFDKVRHSNHQVKNKLVLYFQGKQSICDNLLLRILKSIESQLNESWCSEINVWTLRNSSLLSEQMFIDENLPLIVKGETGQELTLDIRVILETVKKVKIGMQFKFPPDDASYHEWQKSLCEYTLYYENPSIYNDDFLMFVLISCPEIFKEDGTINLKLLVESGGLSFMICCSASPISDLSRSASTVVHSVLSFIDREEAPSYRENTTISILLSKIRFYFLENPIKEIAPSVFIFLGQLLLVLINPGHHLYERAVDYLLAGPGLRQEIPMIKYIMNTASKDSYRDIQWGLETLINALNTKYDLNLYEKSGIYEWVMTLSLSPYFKKSVIKSQIEQLLEKTTMVPGGSFALMTRHAGLAWNSSSPHTPRHNKEQKLCYLFTAPKEKINGWTDHTLNDIF